jgi:hypothetical protein
MPERQERAISETMSVILIIVLLIIATVLITSLLNGTMTRMLQKPALVTVQADQFDTTGGAHIISLYNNQGDHVILNGTSQTDGVAIITLSLISPSGATIPLERLTAMSQRAWQPGDTLYIYQSGGSYSFSDTAPTGVTSLAPGTWKITIQDDKVHVLLHTIPVTIR